MTAYRDRHLAGEYDPPKPKAEKKQPAKSSNKKTTTAKK